MVRENRIKTFTFSETISATSTATFTGSYPINGEILQVDVQYGVGAGSLALSFSGNGLEFWRANAASGAGTRTFFPRVLTQLSTGSVSVAGGARPDRYVGNAPLLLDTGSILSGTSPVVVDVHYR